MDCRPSQPQKQEGETMSRSVLLVLLLATGVALADDAPKTKKEDAKKEDPKLGMSILGNQETPKSLVIVPWKSTKIDYTPGVSPKAVFHPPEEPIFDLLQ